MPSPSPLQLLKSSTPKPTSSWPIAAGLLWSAGFWLGAPLLVSVSTTEAAWAVMLAALFALGSGWLRAEFEFDGSSSRPVSESASTAQTTWLDFTTDWTLGLAKLMATGAMALSLASYLLSQISADAAWLLPVALLAIWAALSQTARSGSPQVLRGWALLVWLGLAGLAGLMLIELVKIAAGWTPPLLQPTSDLPLSWPRLLKLTALLSITLAGSDSLAVSPELPQLEPTRQRKLLSLAVTLGWVLYFGLVMLSQALGGKAGQAAAFGTVLQMLSVTVWLSLGLAIGAIAAFAGALWLQIPSLDGHLRRLLGGQSQRPGLMRVGLGVTLSCLLLVGDIETLWAFSAFAALSHRALLHWQAMRWRPGSSPNRYRHGLAAAVSLMLAFWLEWQVWLVSLGLIALGLVWWGMRQWSDLQE